MPEGSPTVPKVRGRLPKYRIRARAGESARVDAFIWAAFTVNLPFTHQYQCIVINNLSIEALFSHDQSVFLADS